MAVLAIVLCVLGMLLGVFFIVNRVSRLDRHKRNAQYSGGMVVQSELVGLPNATNAGLLVTKRKLLHWLASDPTRQERCGLCITLDYDLIALPCIQTWVYTADSYAFPVEGSGRLYNDDFYKASNPRRRNLAKYMLACINKELEARK